jgi:predicted nuclease of predicted toxin-antitoxin system
VRFLADECLDNRLLMGLRQAGHDVIAARDACPAASDRVVLELARRERRVVVTEDKRVGRLIVRSLVEPPRIVLVRMGRSDVRTMVTRLLAAVAREGNRLHGLYVVVTAKRTRVRAMGLLRGTSP